MAPEPFGTVIGKLIYQRRKTLGLTQTQLAEDAFGNAGKTRRISELENGQVANPHPKTLDPLIVALKITEQEIESCLSKASSKPDPDLDRAYREARNLIEAVARQFEIANPNSSLSELEDFLREKAKEWSALRERIRKIEETDSTIAELKLKATEALGGGRLEEADRFLAEAEDFELTHSTLSEIQKLIQFRVARGDVKLIAELPSEALEHYLSAANFLKPFSESDAAALLNEMAYRIYDSGRKSLTPSFDVARKLLEEALTLKCIQQNPLELSKIHYRISLMYRNMASGSDRKDEVSFKENGILHAKQALDAIRSGALESDDIIYHLVSSQIALGNLLSDKAKLLKDTELAVEAAQSFSDAQHVLRERGKFPELMAHAANSYGTALITRLEIQATEDTVEKLDEVVVAYETAIKAAESCSNFEVWGVANANLGKACARRANIAGSSLEERFLRVKGISALVSALEVYPSVSFPVPYAQTHFLLADLLFRHSMRCEQELSEFYMIRAIGSYELAIEIFGRERHPRQWAHIQAELGRIFFAHSTSATQEIANSDLDRASSHINAALEIYVLEGVKDRAQACRDALRKVESARSAL